MFTGNDGSNIDGPFSTAPGSVLLKQRTVTTPAEGLTNLQASATTYYTCDASCRPAATLSVWYQVCILSVPRP